jgi:L-amino acid N-acyltransferase YncA
MGETVSGSSDGDERRTDRDGPVVRRATPADAAGVARVINEAIADGHFSLLDTPLSVDAEREFIAGLPERGFVHVAEAPGVGIVGVQTLAPYADFATHELDHVATLGTWVAGAWRRRGVGLRLWDETRRLALAMGYEKVVTDVRGDNAGSLAFHAHLGFSVIGTARRQARVGVARPGPDPAAGVAATHHRYVDVVFIECFLATDKEA